jgi:ABC-2 type transport system permease protein
MNFVIFPMLFLSGALYPVEHLRGLLHTLVLLNPMAYGVDLLKHALLGPWQGAGYGGELPVPLDLAALVTCAVVCLGAATLLIAREGGVTRAALRQS